MTIITANGVTFDLDDLTGDDGRGYNESTNDGSGNFFPFYIAVMSAILQDASANLVTTSASSVLIGTGSKEFIIAVDLPLFDGMTGQAVDTADANNFVNFSITNYVSATKTATVNVFDTGGSGTISSWDLLFGTGPQGATGATGIIDINGIAAKSLPETVDEFIIFDVAGAANKKTQLDDMAIMFEVYSRLFI